jgi:hypothetical protein
MYRVPLKCYELHNKRQVTISKEIEFSIATTAKTSAIAGVAMLTSVWTWFFYFTCSVVHHSEAYTHTALYKLFIIIIMLSLYKHNNWAHILRHNSNKSSVNWTYRRTFPAPPVATAFHTGMTCRCKPTFSGATFEWDALYFFSQPILQFILEFI